MRALPLLELRNVGARYGPSTALHGITLSVDPGELVAIMGPNGSGKSTVLRAVSGLVKTTGEVVLDGERILHRTPEGLARRGVMFIPESRGTILALSVLDNLKLGAWVRRGTSSRDLVHVYELFPLLFDRRSEHAVNLSAGEQQQLALGRAMMAHARLLLVDEPSRGATQAEAQTLQAALLRLNEGGSAMILAEQSPALALSVATRSYTLAGGRIVSTLER